MQSEGRLELARRRIKAVCSATPKPSHNLPARRILFQNHPPSHYIDISRDLGVDAALENLPTSNELSSAQVASQSQRRAGQVTDDRQDLLQAMQDAEEFNGRWAQEQLTNLVALQPLVALKPQLDMGGAEAVFRREPSGWQIRIREDSCIVPDFLGFSYLYVLLRNPGHKIANTQVLALVGGVASDPGDGCRFSDGQQLREHFGVDIEDDEALSKKVSKGYQLRELSEHAIDNKAIRSIQAHIGSKKREQYEAVHSGDLRLGTKLAGEIQDIEDHLSKNRNVFGYPRKLRSDSDRAREAVSVAIRRALLALKKQNSAIADHFTNAVELGPSGAIYKDIQVRWSLGEWSVASPDCKFLPAKG